MSKELNNLPANPTPLYKQVTKDELLTAIYENYGMTSLLVKKYDVSFRQLYIALDKFKLRDELAKAKELWVEKAKATVLQSMDSENEAIRLKAAEIAIKCQQPQIAQQINVNDKTIEIKSIFGI